MTVRNLLSLLLVSGGIALANSAAASSKADAHADRTAVFVSIL